MGGKGQRFINSGYDTYKVFLPVDKKNTVLDCGNSGTTARLLISLLSTNPNIQVKIKGDYSLNKRNMAKLIDLMSEFGTTFLPKKKTNFPLTLISSQVPIGIEYKAGVSAQLKSAALLAALNANGVTNVIEEKQSRNHTENILLKSSTPDPAVYCTALSTIHRSSISRCNCQRRQRCVHEVLLKVTPAQVPWSSSVEYSAGTRT